MLLGFPYVLSTLVYPFHLIHREEMEDVVGSVFDLMGRTSDPILEEEVINERVDHLFEVSNLICWFSLMLYMLCCIFVRKSVHPKV